MSCFIFGYSFLPNIIDAVYVNEHRFGLFRQLTGALPYAVTGQVAADK